MDDATSVEEKQKNTDLYNTIVHDISKCSNWQNPTQEADFFSNDPFHREMERLSLLGENKAPVKPGAISGTYWFYERSKNRWEQSTFYMSKSQRLEWNKIHPKNQVITKEKLGMYYNTLALLPYSVCKGGVNNMPSFAETIIKIMAERPETVNSFFFKKYVAAKIIYDATDKIIASADWYPVGGYKAMYVPYTISKIISLLPKNKDVDWKLIWKKQAMYPSLAHQIEIVAKKTMDFFTKESKGGNERTYAIKKETWEKYKSVKFDLLDEFTNDLVDLEENKNEEKKAAKQVRFDNEMDLWSNASKLGWQYWHNIYEDIERQKLISIKDRDLLRGISEYMKKNNNFITEKQAKSLWKIVRKIEEETDYILKEK